jgi:hypothetical protein
MKPILPVWRMFANNKIKRLREAMRHLPAVIMLGVVLSGCSTMQSVRQNLPMPSGSTSTASDPHVRAKPDLPVIDTTVPEKFAERLKPHGFSLGAWILRSDNPKFIRSDGPLFQPVPALDANAAIVYLYRPSSTWNFQEIIAPSFFLNGKRISSLINNHYYWLELPKGTYRLAVRRPVGTVYFQKGTVVDFSVEAGKTYYLRYDEQNFRGRPNKELGLLQSGPISQMPENMALEEIRTTTLNTPGYSFIQNPDLARDLKLSAFNGKPKAPVAADRVEEKQNVVLGVPLKLWNPLTW